MVQKALEQCGTSYNWRLLAICVQLGMVPEKLCAESEKFVNKF